MRILIIDNYDSFTFNLYQYVGEILLVETRGFEITVKRNNEISIQEVKQGRFDRIIISPGPGDPSDPAYFGICADVLLEVGKKTPVLGVCLGMQGIAHYFGGKVIKARVPMHGKTSEIIHDGKGVFDGLPQNIQVMRYHSLVANTRAIPKCLKVSARVAGKNRTREIMGLRHKDYPIEGVQFHPESFATQGGKQILYNFLIKNVWAFQYLKQKNKPIRLWLRLWEVNTPRRI